MTAGNAAHGAQSACCSRRRAGARWSNLLEDIREGLAIGS
jgi:hypothetical protein